MLQCSYTLKFRVLLIRVAHCPRAMPWGKSAKMSALGILLAPVIFAIEY